MSKTHDHDQDPPNPLHDRQLEFISELPSSTISNFFSPTLEPTVRADVWGRQAEVGEQLTNNYAWATPTPQAMHIIRHFSPIIEIGAGSNGYWAKMMKEFGIDVVAYDSEPKTGGRISGNRAEDVWVKKGGPELLKEEYLEIGLRTFGLKREDQ